MALKIAGAAEFHNANLQRFRKLGAMVGIDEDQVEAWVRGAVERQLAGWEGLKAKEMALPEDFFSFIDARLERLPIVRQVTG